MASRVVWIAGLVVVSAAWSHAAAGSSPAGKAIEADWLRQEVIRGRKAGTSAAVEDALGRGGALVAAMRRLDAREAVTSAEKKLAELTRRRDALRKQGRGASAEAWQGLYLAVRWALRDLAFANPLLDFDELLFVRRHWPNRGHQCSHHVGEAQQPGADLCVLKGLSPDGRVRSVLNGQLKSGGIGRPDLSWDADRIVFSYAAPRATPTAYGYGKPGVRGGACHMYDVYEIGVDGRGLRQLTTHPAEDTEPAYLPDGRICFTSSRDDRYVQCGDWALVFCLYTMAPDGSDPRRITEAKEGEWFPSVLADGRIIYMRWEYVMKAFNTIQYLWTVYPDGTRAQLAYGDHFAFTKGPLAFIEARQVPNSSKVIATGAAHHNVGVGPICMVDLDGNRAGPGGFENLTPEVGYPEAGMNNRKCKAGWYASPWPLSEEFYLVCYSFETADNVPNGYGLYLMDRFGNKELIYRDAKLSCYSPIPLKRRTRPPALPNRVEPTAPPTGTVMMADVYQGLPGVKRGEVKYLRVLQTMPKIKRTDPQRVDIGLACGWDVRKVLGTVPVEADGSAVFRVPAGPQIFFEALDADFTEIRRMRSFLNVQPGEVASCVGCHESSSQSPANRRLAALAAPPAEITPPPWGAIGMDFRTVVQPVLTKHCVRCHDGSGEKDKAFDLRGTRMLPAPTTPGNRDASRQLGKGTQHAVSDAFLNLVKYVNYVRVGNYNGGNLPLGVRATGSGVSKLTAHLRKGHNDVKLSRDEWRAICAWIDCNAPFYGDWEIEVVAPARSSRPRSKKPSSLILKVSAAQKKATIERRAELARTAPVGARLVCYLDCGCETADAPETGPTLRQMRGRPWLYHKGSDPVHPRHAAIVFDNSEVVFRADRLDPKRTYTLALTWWDYNDVGRTESVLIRSGGKTYTLLAKHRLPGWEKQKKLPETRRFTIPAEACRTGQLEIIIQNAGPANAVVSEVWLYEK